MVTYPLNNVAYDASDAELFHCTRTSGIFDGDDFTCSVTGADNNVTVGEGIGWIRNTRFSGKVIALKAAMTLDLGVADSENPRIDAVVIRFDANAGQTDIVVKNGVAAASPVPPEVVQTESVYELHLYHIRRASGAAAIAVADLTDLRMDESYCGLMQDDVTPKSGTIDAEKLPIVPITKGGTGSTTAAGALKKLGALPLEGGTMSGSIRMEGNTVAGLRTPTGDTEAAPKSYVDNVAKDATRLPVVPIAKGGTGAEDGATGLKNLLAAGYMQASSYQIVSSVDAIPSDAPVNSIFLVPME